MARILGIALVLALSLSAVGLAETIDQTRGVDSRVDYASLTQFGPWDDRNYQLTQEDLALLAPNEAELTLAIPAFYRVELRKRIPDMLREGPVQYPHSAVPAYLVTYGGFEVDGVRYADADLVAGNWVIDRTKVGFDDIEVGPPVVKMLEGESRVTPNPSAAESAVAINPIDTNIVVAGSNGPGSGQKHFFSTDGGQTWGPAPIPLLGTCCDPTFAWSSDGTKAYAATLSGSINAVWFYRSADGGQTWNDLANEPGNDPRREIGTSGSDKEFIHVDLSPTSPYQDSIYLTWHQSNILRFSKSLDQGHTWSTPLLFSSASAERGIGSDITTDSAGNIYYFWAAFNSQKIWVRKSTDGGDSFAPVVEVDSTNGVFNLLIPSQESRQAAIICSADTDRSGGTYDGSVYVAWTDITAPESSNPQNNHAQVKVAYSRDGGATWTTTIPHEVGDVDTVDRWQPWMTVAPDGTVHIVFNDTRNSVNRSGIDLYHSFSTDGGQTWSTPTRQTTVTSQNATGGFEFGDYSGMDIIMNRLIAVYTDNRDENGGTAQSRDIYAIGQTIDTNVIFGDGFESGDTTAWDTTVP